MVSLPRARVAAAALTLLAACSTAVAQSCYYPDGSFPKDYAYVACTGDSVSSCCIPGEGDLCLSSGACYYKSGNYPFRGACTDKSWASSKCPRYCLNERPGQWQRMVKCTTSKYCCSQSASNLTCCNDATATFPLDISDIVNDYSTKSIGATRAATSSIVTLGGTTVTAGGSIVTVGGSTVTAGGSTVTAGGSIVTVGGSIVSEYPATANRNPAAAATSGAGPPSGSGGDSNTKIIAIAVAVSVVVLVIAALVVWAVLKRKRTNAQKLAAPGGPIGGHKHEYQPQPQMAPMMGGNPHGAMSPPPDYYTPGGVAYTRNVPPGPVVAEMGVPSRRVHEVAG